ncbi:MAG: hypothetical protein U0228_33785 [Myxococcaceae bacterium]
MAAKKKAKKVAPKKKSAPKPKKKAATKAKPKQKSLTPVPDSKEAALAWFGNLANRITAASAIELQLLVGEARTYDLVGLGEVLQDDQQVLELNRAANLLIEAALESLGNTPEAFQLQVLRDILNDS